MRLMTVLVLMVSLACADSFAATLRLPRYGVFVYSNFCRSAMSGDLYGVRVTLHRFWDDDMLVYEYTDGSTHALVAQDLTLDSGSRSVSFKLRDADVGAAQLSGQLSADGRTLMLRGVPFEDPKAVFKLVRNMDFAARVPDCK
jgi:hypothetical protein